MTDEWKIRVENATVRLSDLGGLGVLVPGGFIATATHCIHCVGTGTLFLGGVCPSNVICADGTAFRLGVAAADPVSDMAVLQALDDQESSDDVDPFEEWQQRVVPIPVKHFDLRWEESCPAFVLTHKGKWVGGAVKRFNSPCDPMNFRLPLNTEEQIECGNSGGPVVTEDGELLGVVSHSAGERTEMMPVAHLTLPRWVLDKMVWTGPGDEEMDRFRRILDERINVSRR